jgi:class 3 adenylate cyclase
MVRTELAQAPDGLVPRPRSYLGVPLVSTEGVVLGNVCVIDDKPRPDFAADARLLEQLGALAASIVNLFELRRLRRENAELNARRRLDIAAVRPLAPTGGGAPADRLALLMTDIEGSTELYERDSVLMKQALDVHDAVLRRAIATNGGVEIATEGDAFIVAFHTAADAIRCAFDAQLRLFSAPWPAGLERLGRSTVTDEARKFAGCRVRASVHFTEAGGGLLGRRRFEISRHAVTRRPHYRGPFVEEARFFSEMPSGGQVLVSQSAFDEVALTLTTALGDPRVVDLGRYEAASFGDLGHVYELMPRALAARSFDAPVRVPRTGRLTSPGYIHAPRSSPLVVTFVLPVGLLELQLRSDAAYARGAGAFNETVRGALAEHDGYEMKENEGAFMCAFAGADAGRALGFADALHTRIAHATEGAVRCKVGIYRGDVAIEPHGRTGRLEAFGPACNRAARLAKAANPGQALVDAATAALGAREDVALFELGDHRFKGVEESIRVVQVGRGFHPPIQSLSYGTELVAFGHVPAGNVTRARALLAAMDDHGVDNLLTLTGTTASRSQVQKVLEDGLEERSQREGGGQAAS